MIRPGSLPARCLAAGRRPNVLGALVVLLLWAGVAYKSTAGWHEARRSSDQTNKNFAMVFEENVLRSIGEIDKSLLYMRSVLASRADAENYAYVTGTEDLVSEIIVQVAIIDAKGIMRATSAGPQPPPPTDLSDRDHFKVHRGGTPGGEKTDRLFISRPIVGRASGRLSVQFSRRFLDRNGQFNGVVVASLDPRHLTKVYDSINLGTHASIALIGTDGVVRSSGGDTRGFATGHDLTGSPLLARPDAAGDASFALPGPEGDRLVTLRRVRGYPLWVAVSVARDEVYEDARATFLLDALIAAGLTALVVLVVVNLRRVEARRSAAERQALHAAGHDPLTDLPNRRSFATALEAAASRPSYAVLLLDLDRFKLVNDTLGHGVGDALLVAVGRRLTGVVDPGCVVARLGGDEFAILTADRTDVDAACARIIRALGQPFVVDGHLIRSGVSIGVATGPAHGPAPNALLTAADLALYEAKDRGKDTGKGSAVHYHPALSQKLIERRRIEAELRAALDEGQLQLHYQPSYDLPSNTIVGFEALARWQHPTQGAISPAVFIPVAEDSGLIHQLGAWALARACEAAAAWPRDLKVAVNLSPVQFTDPNLADTVRAILARTGLDPRRLELEITERTFLDDSENTRRVLDALKAIGVRVAMDDFGTGYSSLNYLRTFPFDRIKIDRSFVVGLGQGEKHTALLRAVIEVAQSLGMATTAEGIETEEQHRLLAMLGCGQVQGYLLGRPMPLAQAQALIAASRVPPPGAATLGAATLGATTLAA